MSGKVRSAVLWGIALGLLYWALHDVDVGRLMAGIRAVRVWPLVGAAALITVAQIPLRVARWRYILRPGRRVVPFLPLLHATSIGVFVNYLLPARIGDVVRAYTAGELTDTSVSTTLGSLLAERVADGATTCLLLLAAITVGGVWNEIVVGGWTLGGVALVASAVFGIALAGLLGLALWAGEPAAGGGAAPGGGPVWAARVHAAFRGVVAGLDALRSVERTAAVAVWSVVLWGVSACGVWLGLYAFGISVPLSLAVILQALVALAIAVPSAPGFFGPFEAAARVALSLGAIDSTRALSFSLPFHVVAYFVPVTIIGLWSLSQTGMQLTQLGHRATAAARGR